MKYQVHARGRIVVITECRKEAKDTARHYDGLIFTEGKFVKHEKFPLIRKQ